MSRFTCYFFMALLPGLFCGLLAGCPQRQAAAPGTGSTPAAAPPLEDSSSAPPAGTVPEQAAGTTPPAGSPGAGEPAAAEPDRTSSADQATAEDPAKVTRPQRRGTTDYLPIDLAFVKAEYNDQAGADLSRLSFQFRAKLDRMQFIEDEAELSSYKDSPCGVLKLPQCVMEIYPQLAGPETGSDRPSGRRAIDMEGRYVLVLRTLEGKLIGKFSIDAIGGLSPSMPDQWGKGFAAVLRWERDSQREDGYEIRRTDAAGLSKKKDALFGLRYEGVGYESLSVSDPQGNKFNYKFPSGQLQLLLIK